MAFTIFSTGGPGDFAPDRSAGNPNTAGIPVFDVTLDLKLTAANPGGGSVLVPTFLAPKNPDAVRILKDGTTLLAVPRGDGAIFNLTLSANWDWTFDIGEEIDNAPFRLKDQGHAKYYEQVTATATLVTILAKSTVLIGDDTSDEVQHPFNLYVVMAQPNGAAPLRLRIDPVTDNPPPRPKLDEPA